MLKKFLSTAMLVTMLTSFFVFNTASAVTMEAYDTGSHIFVDRRGISGTAFCAFYNGNKLVKTESSNKSVFVIPYAANPFDTVKIFVWDSLSGMKPLCSTIDVVYSTGLYVSPDGNDTNAGTIDAPLKTLEGAKSKIRALGELTAPVNVYFREGEYQITSSVAFTSADSGTEDYKITYQAYPNEDVAFTGGVTLPALSQWTISEDTRIPSSAMGKVYEYDLSKSGLTLKDPTTNRGDTAYYRSQSKIGEMNYRGSDSNNAKPVSQSYGMPAELFSNEIPLTVARYPNETEDINTNYVYVVETPTANDMGYTMKVADANGTPISAERLGIWESNKSTFSTYEATNDGKTLSAKQRNAILHGFWYRDFQDSSIDIWSVDTENSTITTVQSPNRGIKMRNGGDVEGVGGRFYIYNLLEELDSAGEYYIDRSNVSRPILYYYPSNMNEILELSTLKDNYMITLTNADHITFKNLEFKNGRQGGISATDTVGFTLDNCEIHNFGNLGVWIGEAKTQTNPVSADNSVINSEIYNVSGGLTVSVNSDTRRANLTKAGNKIINNKIHDFTRLTKVGLSGIVIKGVGNYIAHNEIYNGTHFALTMNESNENVIEYNNIHDVNMDTSDAGAIYWCMDMGQQGIKIRYNWIHDIGQGQKNLTAIYADEKAGGAEIYSNIIGDSVKRTNAGTYNLNGLLSNGGGFINVHDNIMYNCESSIRIRYATTFASGSNAYNSTITVPYTTDLWKQTYPEVCEAISTFVANSSSYVQTNIDVKNNARIDCTDSVTYDTAYEYRIHQTIRDNNSINETGMKTMNNVTLFNADGELVPDFTALGVTSFDVNKIGLYDAWNLDSFTAFMGK